MKEDLTDFISPHYYQSFKFHVGISNVMQKELFVQVTTLLTRGFESHFLTECANGPSPFSLITSLIVSFFNLFIFRTQRMLLDIKMCEEVFHEIESQEVTTVTQLRCVKRKDESYSCGHAVQLTKCNVIMTRILLILYTLNCPLFWK